MGTYLLAADAVFSTFEIKESETSISKIEYASKSWLILL